MYKKFSQFKEERDQSNLFNQLDEICFAIAESDKSFEEIWDKEVLPNILEEDYSDAQEFIESVGGMLGSAVGNVGGWLGRNMYDFGANALKSGFNQIVPPQNVQNQPVQAQMVQPNQNLDQAKVQQFMNQNVVPVKNQLARSIQNVVSQMSQQMSQDPQGGHKSEVAKRMMGDVIRLIQNWQPKLRNVSKNYTPNYMRNQQGG